MDFPYHIYHFSFAIAHNDIRRLESGLVRPARQGHKCRFQTARHDLVLNGK
jgi:hypothetical protein